MKIRQIFFAIGKFIKIKLTNSTVDVDSNIKGTHEADMCYSCQRQSEKLASDTSTSRLPLEDEGLTKVTKEVPFEDVQQDLELLYAYIEAELDDENAAERFPNVHCALQISEEAAIQYQDLKEILTAERQGTLVMPDRLPDFDFSYLTAKPLPLEQDPKLQNSPQSSDPASDASDINTLYVDLKGSSVPFDSQPPKGNGAANYPGNYSINEDWRWNSDHSRLFLNFSEDLIQNAQLKRLSTPFLHIRTKSSSEERLLFSYSIDEQEEKDLVITFVATTTANNPTVCDVKVTVDRPSLDGAPRLADSRVYLSQPSTTSGDENSGTGSSGADSTSGLGEPISQSTDPFGITIFRFVPTASLSKLHFAIEPSPSANHSSSSQDPQ